MSVESGRELRLILLRPGSVQSPMSTANSVGFLGRDCRDSWKIDFWVCTPKLGEREVELSCPEVSGN